MTNHQITVYEVGIAIDGEPTYVVEVPTSLDREAAERRAYWVIASQNPSMNLDRITICSPTTEEA